MSEESDKPLLKTIDAMGETIGSLRARVKKLEDERKDPQGVARIMSSYVNTFSDGASESFVDEMSREHRTLQQNFTRLCVAWLHHLGRDIHGLYDDRNKASVMLGRAFIDNIPAELRHLPTI